MNSIQLIKLGILILALTLFAFVGIYLQKEISIQIIMLLDTTVPCIFGITVTAVLFILKHMDSISTATSSLRDSKNHDKVSKTHQSYQVLNEEAVSNIILSLALFILGKILKLPKIDIELNQLQIIVISLKFSCFGSMLYIAFDQIYSLRTIMKFRSTIEINKKQ